MLRGLQGFLLKNRRKFFITSCIVGGVYVGIILAKKCIINYHETKTREFLEKQRHLQHFESTEATCNKVIIGMGGEMYVMIIKVCDTETLLERIRQNPANKLDIWNEVKVQVFTRLMTFVYASSMLVVALRIQLNLLGGYLYQDVTKQHAHQQQKINDELKQKYLSLIRHFMHKGLNDLVEFLHEKCKEILQEYSLVDNLNLNDMDKLFTKLHNTIINDAVKDPSARMSKYLMPSTLEIDDTIDAYNFPILQQMHAETLDLLESDDAVNICNNNISRGFSLTLDAMAEVWYQNSTDNEKMIAAKHNHLNNNDVADVSVVHHVDGDNKGDGGNNIISSNSDCSNNGDAKVNLNISEIRVPLAKIMPIINELTAEGVTTQQGKQTLATSLLTYCLVMEKAKTFGANIYESFSTAQI